MNILRSTVLFLLLAIGLSSCLCYGPGRGYGYGGGYGRGGGYGHHGHHGGGGYHGGYRR